MHLPTAGTQSLRLPLFHMRIQENMKWFTLNRRLDKDSESVSDAAALSSSRSPGFVSCCVFLISIFLPAGEMTLNCCWVRAILELSPKATLSIYQLIYVPTLSCGHELWVVTVRTRSWSFLRARERSSEWSLHVESSQLRWFGTLIRILLGGFPDTSN